MYPILVVVLVLAGIHLLLGLISVCIGVIASIQAEVWLAHSVAPIWSGGFFIINGVVAVACAKKKTIYLIMCFLANSAVSLVTAAVSIQLLRLGLVTHTTDGHTFQKEKTDELIIIGLCIAGIEAFFDIISAVAGVRVFHLAKNNKFQKREGMFHVQILGERDILVVSKPPSKGSRGSPEDV